MSDLPQLHLFRRLLVTLSLAFLAACAGPATEPSADTGTRADIVDVSIVEDVGDRADFSSPVDMGFEDVPPDTGETAEGFGTISGPCGELDDELTSAESTLFRNAIDFGDDPYDDTDAERLTDGGREILADGNENENSILSEVFAYEVLARCEGALLLKTETEVGYEPMSKKTDLLVEIDETKIGVSVTRAVGFPREDPYTVEQATTLLEEKLADVQLSSEGVLPEDEWRKQILHVIAYAPGHADSIRSAYDSIDVQIRADTVVWVTVTDGDDAFLYQ